MQRRSFLKLTGLTGVAALGAGYWALPSGPAPAALSIEAAQALLLQLSQLCRRRSRAVHEPQPEPQRRHVGFVIILFEEHPAQHVGLREAILRDQVRAMGEIPAGSVALGQKARAGGVADLEHRDAPVGVHLGEKLGRPRLALHDVIGAGRQRQAEQRGGEPDLVAVPAAGIFVEGQRLSHCRRLWRPQARSCRYARPLPSAHGPRRHRQDTAQWPPLSRAEQWRLYEPDVQLQ